MQMTDLDMKKLVSAAIEETLKEEIKRILQRDISDLGIPAQQVTLKVKKLHPDARLPVYGTDGAACFDLAALEGADIAAHSSAVIRTALTFEIPEGHVMLIFSRSGHGFKNNIRLANCVGVIDADYRGEVMVKLTSDLSPFRVEPGDRIAQAMVIPFPRVLFDEVEELSSTERGEGGFGSTGVK